MTLRAIKTTVLLAAAFLSSTNLSFADDGCNGQAAAVVQRAYPDAVKASDTTFKVKELAITLPAEGAVEDDPHAVICRVWPAYPELMLVAVPLIGGQSDDGNAGDLELLVLDADSLGVRQRLFLAGRMTDDAVRITRLAFDTARYRLSPKQIAFGLRIFQHGSSGPNPFGEVGLSLYTIADGKLTSVLSGITVSDNHGEWDTNCAGTFDESSRTLSMQPTVHHGYADILVSETSSTTVASVAANGECVEQRNGPKKTTLLLTYDGREYTVPENIRSLE
ncbi:hypothetical protein [Pararhizobium sp. O133]|uniref:hypothetical protein n=1 Tax=Pararhizobium sp. O133 TaxID=3449278 RepID=UPI003F683A58